MRILIACEFSGTARRAFRDMGHEAYSCDLLPSADNSPYHIQGDALSLLNENWDLLIAHPPCTYLSVASARWMYPKGIQSPFRHWQCVEGARFFNAFLTCSIPRVCVENPRMLSVAEQLIQRPYTQEIQPWMFGDPVTKATRLWLKGLPLLRPTYREMPENTEINWSKYKKGSHSGKARSVSFEGIARAMADQWGGPAESRAFVQSSMFEDAS